MNSSSRVLFETHSVDLASFLDVSVAHPVVKRGEGDDKHRAIFTFQRTTALLTAVVTYEEGATLPAKRLLNARSRLYREASAVVKGGR